MSRNYLFTIAGAIILIVISALVFDVVGLISYGLIVVAVWLSIIAVAIWLVTLLLSALRLLNGRFSLRPIFKFTLILLLMGATGLLVMNVYAPPALPPQTASPSEQLRALYETDQGDRLALRLRMLEERDRERLQRVTQLLEQETNPSPEDRYHAATILQHGTESEHFQLAYELARQASDDGYEDADGLWQSAYDRWQISMGRPQVYGTQSTATLTFFGITFQQE